MKRKNFFIAISVIIIPVLIYFLGKAGKQTFNSLPFYGEKVLPEGTKDTVFYTIPDFHVSSQTGETVTQKTFDNSIYIANFFFASCKDVCPKLNAKVESVYKKVLEQNYAEVKFISFTVDPENDSVSVLADYAKKFNADAKKWYFVTGTNEAIVNAGRGFLLPVSMEDTTIDHSQNLILVDKLNHIRGIYNGLDEIEIKRLNEDLKVLLYEYHRSK